MLIGPEDSNGKDRKVQGMKENEGSGRSRKGAKLIIALQLPAAQNAQLADDPERLVVGYRNVVRLFITTEVPGTAKIHAADGAATPPTLRSGYDQVLRGLGETGR